MPPKSLTICLLDTLEDLSQAQFDRLCFQLLNRAAEPRVKQNKVEGKNRLQITDVLVSTFTERGAVPVLSELLRDIDCNQEAEKLAAVTNGRY